MKLLNTTSKNILHVANTILLFFNLINLQNKLDEKVIDQGECVDLQCHC